MALLRWFRFLGAIEVPWEQATRVEARDFSRWVQVAAKPVRPHWRHRDESAAETGPTPAQPSPNPVTDKAPPGTRYAPATAAHSETVLRSFYEFHLEAGSGPMVNPFPLSRNRRGGRANAHHNPMEPFRNERSGLYRPRVVARAPRQIPDEKFDELFAALGSHRDRALVALWVSTGARASELLGLTCEDSDPGQQLITVIRKGSRALQQLPRLLGRVRVAAPLPADAGSGSAVGISRCGGRCGARPARTELRRIRRRPFRQWGRRDPAPSWPERPPRADGPPRPAAASPR